jgi:hypothetical protein
MNVDICTPQSTTKAELFQSNPSSQPPREKKLQLYATLRVYKFSSPKKKETSPNGKYKCHPRKRLIV